MKQQMSRTLEENCRVGSSSGGLVIYQSTKDLRKGRQVQTTKFPTSKLTEASRLRYSYYRICTKRLL